MLTVHACAKINLTLEVLGRRGDGYHEVATVLQTIDLKDTLTFEQGEGLTLRCDHPDLEAEGNLALEAARLLQGEGGVRKGASISIEKGIPVAAGLGGGSSDGAAALRALNRLWGLDLPLERLLQLAPRLGSDVAFFLHGGTALGEGRGERITPLPPLPPSWLVLLRPPVAVAANKTAFLYSSLTPSHFSDGRATAEVAELARRGGQLSPSSFINTFEQVAFSAYDGLEGYWQRFRELGADNVHLAGAGPTLFTLARDKAQGEGIYRSLGKEGLEAYLVSTAAQT